MNEISLIRLYLLRAVYLLIAVAMGMEVWPKILTHTGNWQPMPGVVKCMLGALTLLCLLGLRYPVKMLPLLFWEMAWKTIWLLAVALPAWRSGPLDEDTSEMLFEISVVVLVYLVIPWAYVAAQYGRAHGDRWR